MNGTLLSVRVGLRAASSSRSLSGRTGLVLYAECVGELATLPGENSAVGVLDGVVLAAERPPNRPSSRRTSPASSRCAPAALKSRLSLECWSRERGVDVLDGELLNDSRFRLDGVVGRDGESRFRLPEGEPRTAVLERDGEGLPFGDTSASDPSSSELSNIE